MTEFENVNEYIKMSLTYKEKKDIDTALRYASIASVITLYPRADVCCIMGELYLERGNYTWSKFWYEKAVGNPYLGIEGETIDESSYTWLPLLKLSFISFKEGKYEEAMEYNDSVLLMYPENTDALENKKMLEKLIK